MHTFLMLGRLRKPVSHRKRAQIIVYEDDI